MAKADRPNDTRSNTANLSELGVFRCQRLHTLRALNRATMHNVHHCTSRLVIPGSIIFSHSDRMFTWRFWFLLWTICVVLSCDSEPLNSEETAIDLPSLPPRLQNSDAPRGPEITIRELRIALFGELRGEIEPCGCPTIPFGGFERRAKTEDE